jgi:hypothetical protein
MRAVTSDGAKFGSNGVGLEFGMVYKPELVPLRVGVGFRSAIRTQAQYTNALLPNENGDLVVDDGSGGAYYLPQSVALPWDLNLGVAMQLGRPFNPVWRLDTERIERDMLEHRLRQIDRDRAQQRALAAAPPGERAALDKAYYREQLLDDARLAGQLEESHLQVGRELAQLSRHYLLMSASVLISGSVEDAIGVENMVSQSVQRSGENIVFSPRLGMEGAVLPELLKLRAGTYVEPTRFDTSTARVHGTFGMDVRVLNWNVFGFWPDDYVWRIGLGGDVSRRYFSWGITIGGWYPRQREKDVSTAGVSVGAE